MLSKKKILMVDDEAINLDFFDVMLTKLGFIIDKAQDGEEALEKVKKSIPDLIILDNIMPKISGWEVTKTLKADPKYKNIPIIMFSALDDPKDKVEGFELGVDDYITKPYNFSVVLARIRAVLRNHELLKQIGTRDYRLSLAEELNTDMKARVNIFIESMDALDEAIVLLNSGDHIDMPRFVNLVRDKTASVRKNIAELDAHLERTMAEWADLKKKELSLQALEDNIRKDARPIEA
jgi:DNA-binding response OmpR family regulator